MTTKVSDGGPAFPGEQGHTPGGTWNQTWESGMSLRDYFAALVMQGFCGNGVMLRTEDGVLYSASAADLAGLAYRYADAMLLARAQEVKP